MTAFSVIVPVRNDARRLDGCLRTIAANEGSGGAVEVIVADNGSTDDSPRVAETRGATVLTLPGLRVSELRNAAAARAGGECLAFIDSDHEISSSWFATAADAMRDPKVGACGALCLPPPDGTWVQRMYGALRGRTAGRRPVSWLGAGNMVVRREAFDAVGGFDPSLEACEDVDLCNRLRAAGWTILGDGGLINVHLGDPATLLALFRAERWRGRDNMRVSLRGPIGPGDLPGILMPVVTLGALFASAAGAIGAVAGLLSWGLAAGTAAVPIGLAVLRAGVMTGRAQTPNPVFLIRAFAVALTYDVARALALVTRASHHRPAAPPLAFGGSSPR